MANFNILEAIQQPQQVAQVQGAPRPQGGGGEEQDDFSGIMDGLMSIFKGISGKMGGGGGSSGPSSSGPSGGIPEGQQSGGYTPPNSPQILSNMPNTNSQPGFSWPN